jgi:undecaprenyl-diphosphatase
MEIIQAIILGIVEGLTEFIPVSSTGHLIIAGHLLGFTGEKADTFEIFIQLGAILAVLVFYWRRFLGLFDFRQVPGEENAFRGINGLKLLVIVSLPALILGFITHGFIKDKLFSPLTVAIGLAVGGVAILVVERLLQKPEKFGLDSLTWKDALIIGLFQCVALWPGSSRSAWTMMGAMLFRVERKTAAEFSFFAAVPVIFAATAYDLLKSLKLLQLSDLPMFATGFIVSFIFALIAIRFFIRLLGSTTLVPFGWYRLVLALLVLVLMTVGNLS